MSVRNFLATVRKRTAPGVLAGIAAIFLSALLAVQAEAQTKKPNILVIWGDDIGGFNISANNQGLIGYKTPNIDSIANEGAL